MKHLYSPPSWELLSRIVLIVLNLPKRKLFTKHSPATYASVYTHTHIHSQAILCQRLCWQWQKVTLIINKILICTIKKFIGIVWKIASEFFFSFILRCFFFYSFPFRFSHKVHIWKLLLNMSHKICDVMELFSLLPKWKRADEKYEEKSEKKAWNKIT